jgi:DNA-binding NarL/FixJ family response regulator
MTLTVLVADDQALVRTGLRTILDNEPDIVVVDEAADGVQAYELTRRHRPDLVLMDVRMPVLDGIAATRRIVESDVPSRVLVLTTFDLDSYVYEALKAGASGFVLKDMPRDQLVHAVRVVAGGESLLAPAVTRRLIGRFLDQPAPGAEPALDPRLSGLSQRESQVLRLVAQGMSNAEIAQQLVVSPTTVKTHVASLLHKLAVRDRVQAVVIAFETGLIRRSHQD